MKTKAPDPMFDKNIHENQLPQRHNAFKVQNNSGQGLGV
jgi:hypothetical protein